MQKKSACLKENHKGYTLLEVLLSFMVFSMISFCIPFFMKGFDTIKNEMVPPYYYEWTLFTQSLKRELWNGKDIVIEPNKISFTINDEQITYEKYQQSIRRRVNDSGHEVVLQSVKYFSLSPLPQGMHIELEFINGEKVEKEFFYYYYQTAEEPL
ncbi:competence type IV pilus minor pilin ComGF [Rossellomorea aquimaris]|uniref:competence type IV pilus minor pilin ComGF n=1 Tax=Rossellomorea aquimaris TaxID=189382 RepID=UPI0007D05E4F|nr:competence type IV pilus minor pilin ComGF [Rossellomorea aquimaris]